MASPESSPQIVTFKEVSVAVEAPRSITELKRFADNDPETVFKVQRALKAYRGVNPGPLDGIYGEQVQAAVRTWQKKFNRDVTGELRGKDLSDLLEVSSKLPKYKTPDFRALRVSRNKIAPKKLTVEDIVTEGMVLGPGSEGPAVKYLQIGLVAEGFDPKGPDGSWGTNTSKAFEQWQKVMGKRGIVTGKAKGLQLSALVAKGLEQENFKSSKSSEKVPKTSRQPRSETSTFTSSGVQQIGRFLVEGNSKVSVFDTDVTDLFRSMSSRKVLGVGSIGPDVRELRNLLNVVYRNKNATGGGDLSYFNQRTESRVRGIQKYLGLKNITGKVDQEFWNSFARDYLSSPGMMVGGKGTQVRAKVTPSVSRAAKARVGSTQSMTGKITSEYEALHYIGFKKSDLTIEKREGANRILTRKNGRNILRNKNFTVTSSRGYLAEKRPAAFGPFTTSLKMYRETMAFMLGVQKEIGVHMTVNSGSETEGHMKGSSHYEKRAFDIQVEPKILFAMLRKDGPFTLTGYDKGSKGRFATFKHKATGSEVVWERKNIGHHTNSLLSLAFEYEKGRVSDVDFKSDGTVTYSWRNAQGYKERGSWIPGNSIDTRPGHLHFSVNIEESTIVAYLQKNQPFG